MLAVPLWVGGGSRLKILEALAAGLPVVPTRVGAEGLAREAWRHLDIVEDLGQMAGAVLEAMRAPARVQAHAVARPATRLGAVGLPAAGR
jgi:hypothetical protein